MLAVLTSVGLSPVVYVDHPRHDVFLGPAPSTNEAHAVPRPTAGVDDLERVVAEEVVLGFGLIGIPFEVGEAAVLAVGDGAEVHLDRSLDHPGMASLTASRRAASRSGTGCRPSAPPGVSTPLGSWRWPTGPTTSSCSTTPCCAWCPGTPTAALDRADHLIGPAVGGGWAEVVRFLG